MNVQSGAVKTMFLKLLDMSGQGKTPSVTGEVIAKEILSYYLESTAQFDMSMFAGVSCDGASVTLGKHQVAMTIMKQHVPHFIVT